MVYLAIFLIVLTAAYFLISLNKNRFVRKKPKQNDAGDKFFLNDNLDELKKRAKDVDYKEED